MVAGLAAALLPALSPAPAQAAPVARPTEDIYQSPEATPVCRDDICVHYAQDGTNDVPVEDDGAAGAWKGYADNGVPDYVDLISGSLLPQAAKVFADAGYSTPLPDGTAGGGAQVDFYLAELDDVEGGAYCASTQPDTTAAAAGFCVIDNDYSSAHYGPRLSPGSNLRLDVLHQYAHLVQWAYSQDSAWISAVAAWVEDEVYPNLNRNRGYLPFSAMAKPGISMIDIFNARPHQEEARWIFLRFLSERYPAEVGGLPVVVRDVVQHRAGPALQSRGSSMLAQFTTFTTWNRNPAAYYAEGTTYPTAPLAGNVMLSGATRTRSFDGVGQEFTSHSFRFRPSSTLRGDWRINLRATSGDVFGIGAGKAFVATFKAKSRPAVTRVIASIAHADLEKSISLAFNTSVEWVELRVVTGEVGEAMNLDRGTPVYKVTAKVSRR